MLEGTHIALPIMLMILLSATDATSANTASTIVARDASGNFSAGTITASLTGAASINVLKAGDTMTGTFNYASRNMQLLHHLNLLEALIQDYLLATANTLSFEYKWC